MPVRKSLKTRTRYYNWEGNACCLHEKENGDQVADIYRAGKGLLSIDSTDLRFSGKQIGPTAQQELVDEEITLHRRKSREASRSQKSANRPKRTPAQG